MNTNNTRYSSTSLCTAIYFLVFALFFFAGCSDDNHDDADALVERCWQYAQKNPDGFTINILTFEAPKEGIAVSYAATQNSFDKKDLRKVIDHALSHANIVGGWYNESNGRYYFDSDTLFQESMLDEAIEWGRRNGQQSVFILSEMRSVDIE